MNIIVLIGQLFLLLLPLVGAGIGESWFRLYHISNHPSDEMRNLKKGLLKGSIGPFRAWKISGNHQRRTGEDAGATVLYYLIMGTCAVIYLVLIHQLFGLGYFILLVAPLLVGGYFVCMGIDAISFVVMGKHKKMIAIK